MSYSRIQISKITFFEKKGVRTGSRASPLVGVKMAFSATSGSCCRSLATTCVASSSLECPHAKCSAVAPSPVQNLSSNFVVLTEIGITVFALEDVGGIFEKDGDDVEISEGTRSHQHRSVSPSNFDAVHRRSS